jgi:DNA-binding transcriptional LysR family regulator
VDAGLIVTPLNDPGIFERPLFYEEFVVYVSPAETVYKKRYVLAEDIDVRHLWLLEEGHCMRSHIMNLCELESRVQEDNNFYYPDRLPNRHRRPPRLAEDAGSFPIDPAGNIRYCMHRNVC